MQLEIYTQTLIWGFLLASIFGVVANRTNFCSMGAVSDWINIGDTNRLRAWILAMATAVLGVGILEYLGLVDLSLITSNETSNPPYRTANFVWLRNLIGGLIFGIGMTLASGCGNKTLVRIGEGNMKSVFVFIIMAVIASLMLFTSFDYVLFLQWMGPLSIDFSNYDIPGQDIGNIVNGFSNSESPAVYQLSSSLIVGLALLIWTMKSADFRSDFELILAGLIIGSLVIIAWYITAGSMGQLLLEEVDFMDERPYAVGAQSLSFIAPSAHSLQYAYQAFSPQFLSFGIVTIGGVIFGSFIYTLIFRKVRLEWFASWTDFFQHVIGAVFMGFGGVLAMGCTIGQGISGVATLALGSIVTVIAIIVGSAVTMKYQYYRMMHEDD
jgi:uncharacterized membrane protein YedE/YeeE